jgi:dTDP-4-amino-4,6-dideoxygalactose transaminase
MPGLDLERTRQFTGRAITLPLYPTLNPNRINAIVDLFHGVSMRDCMQIVQDISAFQQ